MPSDPSRPVAENFGQTVRTRRERLGLSQMALAELAGVSQSAVSRAERAAVVVDAGRHEILSRIVEALDARERQSRRDDDQESAAVTNQVGALPGDERDQSADARDMDADEIARALALAFDHRKHTFDDVVYVREVLGKSAFPEHTPSPARIGAAKAWLGAAAFVRRSKDPPTENNFIMHLSMQAAYDHFSHRRYVSQTRDWARALVAIADLIADPETSKNDISRWIDTAIFMVHHSVEMRRIPALDRARLRALEAHPWLNLLSFHRFKMRPSWLDLDPYVHGRSHGTVKELVVDLLGAPDRERALRAAFSLAIRALDVDKHRDLALAVLNNIAEEGIETARDLAYKMLVAGAPNVAPDAEEEDRLLSWYL